VFAFMAGDVFAAGSVAANSNTLREQLLLLLLSLRLLGYHMHPAAAAAAAAAV